MKAHSFEHKCLSLELACEHLAESKKGVDFASFLRVFTCFANSRSKKEQYSKLFSLFDDEKMGCISGKNLRRVIR